MIGLQHTRDHVALALCAASALCVAATLPACTGPTADVRAFWVDESRGAGGERTLHIYTRGSFDTRVVQGLDAVDGALPLLVAPSPRGRGVLVMAALPPTYASSAAPRLASYLDLSGGRNLPLRIPRSASLGYSGAGDVLWWLEPCADGLAIVPLAASYTHALEEPDGDGPRAVVPAMLPLPVDLDELPDIPDIPDIRDIEDVSEDSCSTRVGVVSAADAPILYTLELDRDAASPELPLGARVSAYRVPDRDGVSAHGRALATGALTATLASAWAGSLRCDGPVEHCRLAFVDPDGEGVHVPVQDDACLVQRWSWLVDEPTGPGDVPPPARCTLLQTAETTTEDEGGPLLLAAISPRHYVLYHERESAIVVHDWQTGSRWSAPLLSGVQDWRFRVTQDGRALVAVSPQGALVRVSPRRAELLNIDEEPCDNPQEPVISPSGRWAAWTCLSYELSDTGVAEEGTLVRVSSAGLERHDGVPMWVVSVDDRGAALMWSRPGGGFVENDGQRIVAPRNLYVLSPEGVLERVSSLEPDPEVSLAIDGFTPRWMAARAL